MNANRLYALALNPWCVIGSMVLGFLFGALAPAPSLQLGFIGDIYVDLMKMIILPFMISAVIFSLQRLLREGGARHLLARAATAFLASAAVVVLIGVVTLQVARPGENLPMATMEAFGKIVGSDLNSSDTAMTLAVETSPKAVPAGLGSIVTGLIPSNIFAALASGDSLKALVFALLFGLAVGHVPHGIAIGLNQSLETIYRACQTLMHWFNFVVPLVLFCMSAAQMAKTGIEPLQAMAQFVFAFLAASLLCLAVAVVVLWKRTGQPLRRTLDALRAPFALALATRSSAACMPSMIEALVDRLGFERAKAELLVPLSVTLLRTGPMVYYVCATLFIAQLYGRSLSAAELAVVAAASIMAGLASSGMTGLVTISLASMTCGYLGLPFEAAFVLFVAVDPICDMLRTLILVIGNVAAVAVACERPHVMASDAAHARDAAMVLDPKNPQPQPHARS
jgi:Na+/H+-dicarboxylate symporter